MKTILASTFILLLSFQAQAQNKLYPVIEGYGAIEIIDFQVELPNPTKSYKLINELYLRQENKAKLYGWLDYAARIMNAHVAAGVPEKNIKLAVVIFNEATSIVLDNDAYLRRFGMNNPNIELLDRMIEAGIEVIVCAQSMVKQDISPDMLHKGIQKAFSRITATSTLINSGYTIL